MIPRMPKEFESNVYKDNCYTKTKLRKWTNDELNWCKLLKEKGFSNKEIAISTNRTETSISIKMKRISKKDNTYNQKHIDEKYYLNEEFLKEIEPETVLDLYCGEKNFYKDYKTTTNDKSKLIKSDYTNDALKTLCYLYSQNKKYDLIDLDPFGSAYECFDLAIKMSKKGLAITLGELGHKRWKRLDFVRERYNIYDIDQFTIENLINHIIKIGIMNNKKLVVWKYKEWKGIGRVYFKIEPLKKTEQWSKNLKYEQTTIDDFI